jgi:hypothetical protein
MSAYAISQLPVVIDSTLIPDMGMPRARPSIGTAFAAGAMPTRLADVALNVEFVDLEPHWLAAVDAATD